MCTSADGVVCADYDYYANNGCAAETTADGGGDGDSPSSGGGGVICLTEADCEGGSESMGLTFYAGDYPTKGCFSKNGVVYFSPGTEEEMSTPDPLAGVRERVYCGDGSPPDDEPGDDAPAALLDSSSPPIASMPPFAAATSPPPFDPSAPPFASRPPFASPPPVEYATPPPSYTTSPSASPTGGGTSGPPVATDVDDPTPPTPIPQAPTPIPTVLVEVAEPPSVNIGNVCLTEEACRERNDELNMTFAVDDGNIGNWKTRGCFMKNNHVFFSLGTVEEMSDPGPLQGVQERVYCPPPDPTSSSIPTAASPTTLSPISDEPSTSSPTSDEPSTSSPTADAPTSSPTSLSPTSDAPTALGPTPIGTVLLPPVDVEGGAFPTTSPVVPTSGPSVSSSPTILETSIETPYPTSATDPTKSPAAVVTSNIFNGGTTPAAIPSYVPAPRPVVASPSSTVEVAPGTDVSISVTVTLPAGGGTQSSPGSQPGPQPSSPQQGISTPVTVNLPAGGSQSSPGSQPGPQPSSSPQQGIVTPFPTEGIILTPFPTEDEPYTSTTDVAPGNSVSVQHHFDRGFRQL